MKRLSVIAAVIVVLLVLFVPVIKVIIVPGWTIRVVDESGRGQADIEVRQTWNHYSFDGSGISGLYGGQEVRVSDAHGEIGFPERSFHTSIAAWALATIGSPLRWINVHASTGPDAYFMCLKTSCSIGPSYRGNRSELENNVITLESEETVRRRLDKIRQEYESNVPNGTSEDTAPAPPRKKTPNR